MTERLWILFIPSVFWHTLVYRVISKNHPKLCFLPNELVDEVSLADEVMLNIVPNLYNFYTSSSYRVMVKNLNPYVTFAPFLNTDNLPNMSLRQDILTMRMSIQINPINFGYRVLARKTISTGYFLLFWSYEMDWLAKYVILAIRVHILANLSNIGTSSGYVFLAKKTLHNKFLLLFWILLYLVVTK